MAMGYVYEEHLQFVYEEHLQLFAQKAIFFQSLAWHDADVHTLAANQNLSGESSSLYLALQ